MFLISPLEQFQILSLIPIRLGDFDISFTNGNLIIIIALISFLLTTIFLCSYYYTFLRFLITGALINTRSFNVFASATPVPIVEEPEPESPRLPAYTPVGTPVVNPVSTPPGRTQ